MRKSFVACVALVALAAMPGVAVANHGVDEHSRNMRLVANFDDGGTYRQGADEAFWGSRAFLSSYDNPGGFRVVNISDPANPRQIGLFECPGPQADISVWGKLAFVSVDSPRSSPKCGAGAAAQADVTTGSVEKAWEGIRIVDVSRPAAPKQVKAVYTDCGSHTNTLVPTPDKVFIYAESYPLGGQGARCNAATHGKISVIAVPLDRPGRARVVSTPSVRPAVGCHDVTAYPKIGLAAAACITETQIWDIADPASPRVLSRIVNPAINIHHSTTFSWDGRTAVIGDELGGAEASPGCPGADDHLPLGALWFYDVSDPANPVQKGTFHVPQEEADSLLCTAHNFNTVPLRSQRDVLVSAWYNGGTTVVDFTDPADPRQLGHYIAHGPTQSRTTPVRSAAWSSYWYNGHIYANNFDEDLNSLTESSRGLDVFAISDGVFSTAANVPHLNAATMEPFQGYEQALGR